MKNKTEKKDPIQEIYEYGRNAWKAYVEEKYLNKQNTKFCDYFEKFYFSPFSEDKMLFRLLPYREKHLGYENYDGKLMGAMIYDALLKEFPKFDLDEMIAYYYELKNMKNKDIIKEG